MDIQVSKQSIIRSSFAMVVVSFLLSTTVSLASMHIMSRHNVRETNKALATQIYDYISGELAGPIMTARTMACNSYLIDALQHEAQTDNKAFEAAMTEYLTAIENSLGYQRSFVISDASGKYFTRNGLNRVIDTRGGQDSWYAGLVGSDDQYDLDVDADVYDKANLAVYVNAKITSNSREALGVCGIGVHMTGIQNLFRSFEESFDVKIDFVDSNGIVQVDTDDTRIESVDLGDMIDNNKSGEYVYRDLGGDRFAVTKYVGYLDWYLVIQSDGVNKASRFAYIILINALLCIAVLVILFVALRINRRKTDELQSASLVDHATMLGNRRAYEHDKALLQGGTLKPDVVCVTADVNGLKTVNDTLGHDAGDELICGVADCLRECFEQYGKVYRIGGDEFAALLHVPEGALEGIKEHLAQVVSEWSGDEVDGVSVSCGYAEAREFPDMGIADLAKVSDERMYEEKERYYQRMGIDRRRT